ncbi:cytochrome ubiquinol oxidase subunit I [Bacterioplanes sanyensis]|uniref:cytochrome ubiquinol oxidase subunit I n=1 Tax=Bacterioplanes sanyensis TaxID=1249553 RepID=UPI0016787785|nr:cytochrome ubiquinol oxidase subunit I [Bacterioplanes sanyensis]GGY58357.1 cytochrome ubiquinol oxidase subunit I [Bacterioplanes sanyensis]
MPELDATLLARIQFAFTISFHIIFPAITIGLACYLAVLEGLWLKSRQTKYINLYTFWSKIFAVNFGMGVVSGIVMAYQFGTHWRGFSEFAGSITGPLLTYEVLTAFFLEAGFLGVMLFGREKVGERLHFFATCMVALGTVISTFWILASNSWMQTPQGHAIVDGRVVPLDWWAVIFNPSFPYRLAHMCLAAFISTAFLVAGAAAWHLLQCQRQHCSASPEVKTMLSMAMWMALAIVPLQMFVGDMHGLNTLQYQPTKVAAMEAHYSNADGEPTPLILFGWPDSEQQTVHWALEVPALASLILLHDSEQQVPALDEFPRDHWPNVPLVFWSFRLMVGLGLLMLAASLWALWLRRGERLYQQPQFLRLMLWLMPSGLVATLAGWFTTEVGRQPWVVQGLLRTEQAVSAHTAVELSISLLAFVLSYLLIFGLGYFYMWRLIVTGPSHGPSLPTLTQRVATALSQEPSHV